MSLGINLYDTLNTTLRQVNLTAIRLRILFFFKEKKKLLFRALIRKIETQLVPGPVIRAKVSMGY